jgi:hypothetical protein
LRKSKFQLKLESLGFKTYVAYLQSDHWKEFRKRYFLRHKRICFCCGKKSRDLHHIDYSYLGEERHKDVKPLCRSCHKKVHKLIRKKNVPLNEAHLLISCRL